MDEQPLFYPAPPTWSSKWCAYGQHWAETDGDTRIWVYVKCCPDCFATRKRAERAADPALAERVREQQRQKWANNDNFREHRNAAARERYHRAAAAPEYRAEHNARQREYTRTPEGKAAGRRSHRNYRARKADAVCRHGAGCFDAYAKTLPPDCANCGTTAQPTADHIIPISKGGLDCRANCQILCRPCNSSKGARVE